MVQTVITILKTNEKHYIEDLVELECLKANITYRTKDPITKQLGFFKPNKFIIVKDEAESTSTTYKYVVHSVQCPSGSTKKAHSLYECIKKNVGMGVSYEKAEVYCNSYCVHNCLLRDKEIKCENLLNKSKCMKSIDSSKNICYWNANTSQCITANKICGCIHNTDCSTNEHCAYNMCQTNKLGSLCKDASDCSSKFCVERGISNRLVKGVFNICQSGIPNSNYSGCYTDNDCISPQGLHKGVCADSQCRDGSYNSPCNTTKDCLSNICVNNPDNFDDISRCKLGQLNDICKSDTDCSGSDLSCQKWGTGTKVGTCQKSFFNYDQKIFCNNLSDCPNRPGNDNQLFPALACKERLDQSVAPLYEKVCWYGLPNSICSVNAPKDLKGLGLGDSSASSNLCRLTMIPGDDFQPPQGYCVPGVRGQYGLCSLGTLGDPCYGSNMCSPVPGLTKGVCAGYNHFSQKHGVCSNGNINSFCQSNNDCLKQPGATTGICAINPKKFGPKALRGFRTCQNPNRNGMPCSNDKDCTNAGKSDETCNYNKGAEGYICTAPCAPLQDVNMVNKCTQHVNGRGTPMQVIIKDLRPNDDEHATPWLSMGPHIYGWISDEYCKKSIENGGGRCTTSGSINNRCYLFCQDQQQGVSTWDEFVKDCIWDKDHLPEEFLSGGPFYECDVEGGDFT